MQLGVFTRDDAGVLTGSIRTLSATVDDIEIVPAAKRGPASPDYRVYGPTGSDFGAGWNKISKDGKTYVSLVLQDPAFNNGAPLYPILVGGENGEFVMAWDATDPSKAAARPAATPADKTARADAPAPGRRQRS